MTRVHKKKQNMRMSVVRTVEGAGSESIENNLLGYVCIPLRAYNACPSVVVIVAFFVTKSIVRHVQFKAAVQAFQFARAISAPWASPPVDWSESWCCLVVCSASRR